MGGDNSPLLEEPVFVSSLAKILRPIDFMKSVLAEFEMPKIRPANRKKAKRSFKYFRLIIRAKNINVKIMARIGPFLASRIINITPRTALRADASFNGNETSLFNNTKGDEERSSNDAPAGRGLSEKRRICQAL